MDHGWEGDFGGVSRAGTRPYEEPCAWTFITNGGEPGVVPREVVSRWAMVFSVLCVLVIFLSRLVLKVLKSYKEVKIKSAV